MSNDPLHDAREAFLSLIADAIKFEEDVDGDYRDGRTVCICHYRMTVEAGQLADLVDALGIPRSRGEAPGAAIDRVLDHHTDGERGVTP